MLNLLFVRLFILEFNDSIGLVVYIKVFIAWGYLENVESPFQLEVQDWVIWGYFLSQSSSNSKSAVCASSSVVAI